MMMMKEEKIILPAVLMIVDIAESVATSYQLEG
jgi:hypothetical protein